MLPWTDLDQLGAFLVSNAEIDEHILAASNFDWLKVARIISVVGSATGLDEKEWGYDAIAKRLRVLVRKRQLEAAGNIWNWRRSEVRLPASKAG